jgi:hypothetical protein
VSLVIIIAYRWHGSWQNVSAENTQVIFRSLSYTYKSSARLPTDGAAMLTDRIAQLQLETQDLREQNELLEFRILELEECHDNVSQTAATDVNSGDEITCYCGTVHSDRSTECTTNTANVF